MSFGQDYAGTKLGEEWGRLGTLAGFGQTSANVQTGAAMNTANQNSRSYQDIGDARASGILGQYGALIGGAQSIGGAYGNYLQNKSGATPSAYQNLSDPNLYNVGWAGAQQRPWWSQS